MLAADASRHKFFQEVGRAEVVGTLGKLDVLPFG